MLLKLGLFAVIFGGCFQIKSASLKILKTTSGKRALRLCKKPSDLASKER